MKKSDYKIYPLLDKQVGWVRINKPLVNHNNGYECAAWWQQETSVTGVFPLILRMGEYDYHGRCSASAAIPAKVTDCYFGSLWGGNAIGKYDKSKDLGRDATIYFGVSLPKLIETTDSPRLDDKDYTPLWEHVPAIIEYWKDRSLFWLDAANEWRLKGDDAKTFGTMGTYAKWAGEFANEVEEMDRHLGYMTEKHDSWRKLHARNFDWVPSTVTSTTN